MKKITINKFCKEQNEYCVYLGNGTAHKFGSKQDTQQFLNISSRFLTQRLYEARDIYISVWNKYQTNWGYFSHNKASMNADLRETDRFCARLLQECENTFNIAFERCTFTNGNYFVFTHLNNAIDNLTHVVRNLSNISRKQSATAELYCYDNLYKRLQNLKSDLQSFGFVEAKHLFAMPQHIDMNKEFIPNISKLYAA